MIPRPSPSPKLCSRPTPLLHLRGPVACRVMTGSQLQVGSLIGRLVRADIAPGMLMPQSHPFVRHGAVVLYTVYTVEDYCREFPIKKTL